MANQHIKQFLSIFALVANILATSAQAAAVCDQVVCANVVKAQKVCTDVLIVKSDCGACHNITAKDFMDAEGNLSQTVVIDQPGRWCLCENINFNPSPDAAFQPAIQIVSSDVHLDLGQNTLRQVNKDVLDIYGVQIGYGFLVDPSQADLHFDNITITNGSINEFSAVGIFCYNPTYDFLDVPFAFNSINLTHLNILDNGTFPNVNDAGSGINLDSSAPSVLEQADAPVAYGNVNVDNCRANHCLGTASIFINTVDNLTVSNTQANDFYTESYPIFGVSAAYYFVGRNIQMFNCQGNGVTDLTPQGAGQCGSFIQNSFNVHLKDCQFNDTYGESNFIINFNASNCHNFVAQNCQFNNSQGGDRATVIAGVHISDFTGQMYNANGLKFIDCQFNGARVSDNNATSRSVNGVYGLLALTLRNVVIENCQACNIITENPNFHAYGFILVTFPEDTPAPFANGLNFTYKNCIASDITGGKDAIGFNFPSARINYAGSQSSHLNMVAENCIAERIRSASTSHRIAGIADCLFISGTTQFPLARNFFVRNCRVSDIRCTNDSTQNPLSAGILVESVINPVLSNNSVSDCDRGILLTGTNQLIPNAFQVAATLEDALAFPPTFINLINGNVEALQTSGGYVAGPNNFGDLSQANRYETTLYQNQSINTVEFGLFNTLANRGADKNYNLVFRVYDSDPSGETPNNILKEVIVNVADITFSSGNTESAIIELAGLEIDINTIASPYFFIAVDFTEAYLSADPYLVGLFLTTVGTVPVNRAYNQFSDTSWSPYNSPDNWGYNGDLWINPQLCLNTNPSDCAFVNNAQEPSVPYQYVNPIGQTFSNLAQLNTVTVQSVDAQRDFIFPAENLNTLGWQSGDPIFYDCQGGDALPDLVCSTTYYAIVYSPGFARNGVIQDNEVDNCDVSGYQDDAPTTSSAWVNNFAFNNGTPSTAVDNYAINWAGIVPVTAGDLSNYPTGAQKAYNVSLIP